MAAKMAIFLYKFAPKGKLWGSTEKGAQLQTFLHAMTP